MPVRFASPVQEVTTNSWLMLAEAKDNEAQFAGWSMNVGDNGSVTNAWDIEVTNGSDTTQRTSWDAPMSIDTSWHTLSICTNNANDYSGKIYGVWFDGVRETFNHGFCAGQQTCGGFPIISDGAGSWPLDIDDYTGGSPSNVLIHGAPLIAAYTPGGMPPEPPGGWNSP